MDTIKGKPLGFIAYYGWGKFLTMVLLGTLIAFQIAVMILVLLYGR